MRPLRRWLIAAAALLAALLISLVLVARSDWLREKVRTRVVETLEKATGGTVELARFDYDWSGMRARVDGLTVRGTEGPDREPLLRAESISLAIHVRSMLRRQVDLRELVIDKPRVHVYVAEDGTTNLPGVKRDPAANPVEALLKLAVGKLRVEDGVFEYDSRQIPLQIAAEGVRIEMTHVAAPLHYRVQLITKVVRLPQYADVGLDLEALFYANRAEMEGTLRLASGASTLRWKGALEDFKNPSAQTGYELTFALADLREGPVRRGTVEVRGEAEWNSSGHYAATGRVDARQLAIEDEQFRLGGIAGTARMALDAGGARFTDVRAGGFGGTWEGSAEWEQWRRLKARGTVHAPLSVAIAALRREVLPWDGQITAPFEFAADLTTSSLRGMSASAKISVSPMEGQLPVEGALSVAWNQREDRIVFAASSLTTPSVTMHFYGVLGERLEVGVLTSDLHGLEPYLRLLTGNESLRLPVQLDRGEARVEAVVSGPMGSPVVDGQLLLSRLMYEKVAARRAETTFHVSEKKLRFDPIEVEQNGARVTGSISIGLDDWRVVDNSPVKADLQVRALDLSEAARIAGLGVETAGHVDATLAADGAWDAPRARVQFHGGKVRLAEQEFDSVTGSLRMESAERMEFAAATALDKARIELGGNYLHKPGDWRNGDLELRWKTEGLTLSQLRAVRTRHPDIDAEVRAEGEAALTVRKGEMLARRVNGYVSADGIRDGQHALGTLRLDAATQGETVEVKIGGRVRETQAAGQATVRLAGKYPSEGRVRLQSLPLEFLAEWLADPGDEDGPWPIQGAMEADLRWRADLSEWAKGRAQITIPRFELRPREEEREEFTLRNASPLQFEVDASGLYVRNARFVARDTTLTLAGLYSFSARTAWDLSLNGSMNLAILGSFEPDLSAAGTAQVNANLRGSAASPIVSGKMTIANASLFLRGLPNGLDDLNGVIYFDRDRATIESFTATTGGGKFSLTGFVGFGRGELSYRLQAGADRVRVRYPEGVSTTMDAALSLTGSSNASMLTGLITVRRSGFSGRGDLGSLIAGSANPIPVPTTQNELLRNMQFDVRVRTSPDATIQTDYTQDIQTEADLRVRGSVAKPLVLGTVMVNQGEINFFGNRYTISRGEILFFSTAAIQPSINLDLETRIRGVIVYINVNGPLSRLNVNYRSEPPLQSREILALLTVGRAPTATSSALPTGAGGTGPLAGPAGAATLADASNTLLGGALSASVSSRVERFFGASRIKIDPNVTGVENIPQARLSLEQSLSRDVTLTFSSNLSRGSQQIIRLEWDVSRQWSVVAVRDENGSFGVDFLFRKRFR